MSLQLHPLYITWREALRADWYEVIIRPNHPDGLNESLWACDNLEGYFSFRRFYDSIQKNGSLFVDSGIVFIFEYELDAMAFKLTWV